MSSCIESPLHILICNPNQEESNLLTEAIHKTKLNEWVKVNHVDSLIKAQDLLLRDIAGTDINTVFINPLTLGLDDAARFIFTVRLSFPHIVFVLTIDEDELSVPKELFYAGERKRFRHYYKVSERLPAEALKDKIETVLFLAMSDLRVNVAMMRMRHRYDFLNASRQPSEIADSTRLFRARYSTAGPPVGFVMMRFGQTKQHKKIWRTIKEELESMGVIAVRADDITTNDHLFYNIMTLMHNCDFGVAVIERIENEHYNPNVSLEVGYMMALGKPICFLRDKTLKTMHTDLIGFLSHEFDVENMKSLRKSLQAWVESKSPFQSRSPNFSDAES